MTRKEIDIELRKSVNQQGLRNFLLKNIYRMNDGNLNFRFNLQSLSQNIGKIGQKIESETQFTSEVIFIKGETSDYINESDKVMINNLFPNAKFYKSISFEEAISKNLRIMDGTALTLAKDHKLPIKVFNLKDENSLSSIAKGEDIGTLIS